ncbi:hypothetical protein F5Y05DRAFT_408489 [Hypoxylon sp. FL0543]|nr:hypothetical protein F5Y05DRAFT_408489 [Hypoxylon sp. FL0543]
MGSLDKENLARVRDNQRRSRARRREYVAELEARLRKFERHGAEINHAIQQVARKVAEDNKKLRALLKRLGYNSERISSFFQTGNAPCAEGTSSNFSQEQEDMIQTLELLLASNYPEEPEPKTNKSSSTPRSIPNNRVESNVAFLEYDQAKTGTLDTRVHGSVQTLGAQFPDASMLEFEPQGQSLYSTSNMHAGDILNEQLRQSLGLPEQTNSVKLDQAIQKGTDLIRQDIMCHEQKTITGQYLGEKSLAWSPSIPTESSYSTGNMMLDPLYQGSGYSDYVPTGQCLDNTYNTEYLAFCWS